MCTTDRRLELHELLKSTVGEGVTVYFQPPPNVNLEYPALVYERDDQAVEFAGNLAYFRKRRYQLKLIGRDPDSDAVRDAIEMLPSCRFERFYVVAGLNHDVYNLYF